MPNPGFNNTELRNFGVIVQGLTRKTRDREAKRETETEVVLLMLFLMLFLAT
jgi:hypothetical protein